MTITSGVFGGVGIINWCPLLVTRLVESVITAFAHQLNRINFREAQIRGGVRQISV